MMAQAVRNRWSELLTSNSLTDLVHTFYASVCALRADVAVTCEQSGSESTVGSCHAELVGNLISEMPVADSDLEHAGA